MQRLAQTSLNSDSSHAHHKPYITPHTSLIFHRSFFILFSSLIDWPQWPLSLFNWFSSATKTIRWSLSRYSCCYSLKQAQAGLRLRVLLSLLGKCWLRPDVWDLLELELHADVQLWYGKWVLGTEFRSSARAVHALSCWFSSLSSKDVYFWGRDLWDHWLTSYSVSQVLVFQCAPLWPLWHAWIDPGPRAQ